MVYSTDSVVARINKFNNLHYTFKKKSLGATINAILLGIKTQLPTTIINYSIEPEVTCVIDFFKKAGLKIKKDDKSVIATDDNKSVDTDATTEVVSVDMTEAVDASVPDEVTYTHVDVRL